MTYDMGTFRTNIKLENPAKPGARRRVEALPVDTGSELTWVPTPLLESLGIARVKRRRFRQATGQVVEPWTGGATVFAAGTQTLDDVEFGKPAPGRRRRDARGRSMAAGRVAAGNVRPLQPVHEDLGLLDRLRDDDPAAQPAFEGDEDAGHPAAEFAFFEYVPASAAYTVAFATVAGHHGLDRVAMGNKTVQRHIANTFTPFRERDAPG